jgi:hypothetical protein
MTAKDKTSYPFPMPNNLRHNIPGEADQFFGVKRKRDTDRVGNAYPLKMKLSVIVVYH